jgi:predicted O-methyltransferase YrrM
MKRNLVVRHADRPGGLILFDNTLWDGRVADPDDQDEDTRAIRALNDRLLGDPRVTPSLVPIGDGLIQAVVPIR